MGPPNSSFVDFTAIGGRIARANKRPRYPLVNFPFGVVCHPDAKFDPKKESSWNLFASPTLYTIKHPRLPNHPAQYHIIQIIRRNILGVQAHALIFSRLSFSQLERDAVDGG